jgi:AcrR family transcriptional regulator
MSETPSKREQLRQERRHQILSAALTVFIQKGFHATNVSDVAAQAGVSQGTIYWYFDSKEELFNAALLSFFEDFSQEAFGTLEQYETAFEKLQAMFQGMEAFCKEAEGLLITFLSYWASSPGRGKIGHLWIELLVQYKNIIAEVVKEGIRNGEFRAVDADHLVWAVMAAYDGLAAYVMLMPELDLGRINQVFFETLLRGLQIDGQENAGRGK